MAIEIEDAGVPMLIIRSEEDAWHALERAVAEGGFPDGLQLRFDGWPSFKLDVSGRDWNSTVPTRVMPSLLEVQKDINRAYAHIRYDDFNLRRLKEEERDDLEVVVKVKKGSSIFDADLWNQFSKMAEAAIGRMDGNQTVIAVIGVALTIMTPVVFKAWLKNRTEQREMDTRVQLSKEETQRLQVMAEAMRQHPPLEVVRDDAVATANKLLKAARPGDNISMKGVQISAEDARELVQPERERANEIELAGDFTVLGNRTDKGDGFRVTVRRIGDGLTVSADVPKELPWAQQEAIQKAEWLKAAVHLEIRAEVLRESFSKAVVLSAVAIVADDGFPFCSLSVSILDEEGRREAAFLLQWKTSSRYIPEAARQGDGLGYEPALPLLVS